MSSVLYVAICDYQNSESTASLFSDANKAVGWANKVVQKCCQSARFEGNLNPSLDWLFYARYTCGHLVVRVIRTTVDRELE